MMKHEHPVFSLAFWVEKIKKTRKKNDHIFFPAAIGTFVFLLLKEMPPEGIYLKGEKCSL